jgi:hypothetical protein
MQIFTPGTVIALKLGALAIAILLFVGLISWRTVIAPRPARYAPVEQAIPFSHKHHVGDDGLDCRYCHDSVEKSAFAGIPPLSTCMSCHSQLFRDAPVLALLRDSFARGQGLVWRRVNFLPGFVYFDHSIHIAKGVGCSTCHGRIDQMALTERTAPLQMQWCLGCHRRPEAFLREPSQVFDMSWQAPADQLRRGQQLRLAYHLHSTQVLTACSTCHR